MILFKLNLLSFLIEICICGMVILGIKFFRYATSGSCNARCAKFSWMNVSREQPGRFMEKGGTGFSLVKWPALPKFYVAVWTVLITKGFLHYVFSILYYWILWPAEKWIERAIWFLIVFLIDILWFLHQLLQQIWVSFFQTLLFMAYHKAN